MARIALISSCFPEQVVEPAKALKAAGFQLVSSGPSGLALARAAVDVLPVEFFSKEKALLGGRFGFAAQRVLAGIAGHRDVVSEVEELGRQGVAAVDVVMIELPTSCAGVGVAAGDRAAAARAIALGGFVADASALEAAVLNADAVLPLTSARRALAWIAAAGHDSVDRAGHRALAEEAWLHLGAYRAFVRWAFDLPELEERAAAEASPTPKATAARITAPGIRRSGTFPAASPAAAPGPAPTDERGMGGYPPELDDDDEETGFEPRDDLRPVDLDLAAPSAPSPAAVALQLPPRGVARMRLDARLDGAWLIDGATPQAWTERAAGAGDRLADLAAGLAALERLGVPGVAVARSGHLVSLARLTSTPARALLRALAGEQRPGTVATVVTTLPIDLTSARVIAAQGPGVGVRRVATVELGDSVKEILDEAGITALRVEPSGATRSHRLGSDALGVWATALTTPVAADTLGDALVDEGLARAAHLAICAIDERAPFCAAVAGPEQVYVVVTGQADVADAVQIALGKARKVAEGAVLVVHGALTDEALVRAIAARKVAAVVHRPSDEGRTAAEAIAAHAASIGLVVVSEPARP